MIILPLERTIPPKAETFAFLPLKRQKNKKNDTIILHAAGTSPVALMDVKHNTRLVLREATGGDQHKLVIALTNDEIRVNVANPTTFDTLQKVKDA